MHRACTSEEMVSGRKPWSSMARAVFQPKEPMPWPMSNSTPRCARRQHLGLDRTVAGDRRIRERPEAMGRARRRGAGARPPPRRRAAARRYAPSSAGRSRRRPAARCRAARCRPARWRGGRSDLDADDQVPVGLGHLDRVARRHQADVVALADHDPVREAEDAGEGDVQDRPARAPRQGSMTWRRKPAKLPARRCPCRRMW